MWDVIRVEKFVSKIDCRLQYFFIKNKIIKNLHCDHNYKNKTSTKAL